LTPGKLFEIPRISRMAVMTELCSDWIRRNERNR
jgi:hypothetical protein